jgi:hypothetical protein
MLPKSSDVRRSIFILLAGVVAASAWGQSPTRTLSIKYGEAEQKLTFNPNLISEDEVRRFAQLSPNTSEYALNLSPTLELCVAGKPEYLECGSRDLHAKNFYRNAEINLKKGSAALRYLADLQHPRELDPIVEYLSSSLTFALWREQTRLDFYKSWNLNVLRREYQDLKPNALCSTVIQAISMASTEDEKYRLAREWSTCLLRARPQPYPEAAWRRFLKAYGITELVEEADTD